MLAFGLAQRFASAHGQCHMFNPYGILFSQCTNDGHLMEQAPLFHCLMFASPITGLKKCDNLIDMLGKFLSVRRFHCSPFKCSGLG